MTHGQKREEIIAKIIEGQNSTSVEQLLSTRSKMPPPPEAWFKGLLEASKEYGILYGNPRTNLFTRRRWAAIHYSTALTFICFGLRPSEGVALILNSFVFNPYERFKVDYPPCVVILTADTMDAEPKGGEEGKRTLPIPTRAIPLFKECFNVLRLRPIDFVLFGRNDRMGNPRPIHVRQIERCFKTLALACSKKRPDLRVDPETVFPYLARKRLSSAINAIARDNGIMAGQVLGHSKGIEVQGKTARKHYIIYPLDEVLKVLDQALENILPPKGESALPLLNLALNKVPESSA